MNRFTGRIAVVTGASRGLGRQVAADLAVEGAHVVVGYRTRKAAAAELLGEIQAAGGRGETVALDVRDNEAVRSVMQGITGNHGRVDILINNAGVMRDALYAMMGQEEWDHVLAVNLTGTHNCCRAVLPGMMARRQGVIVNVASLAGIRASAGQANYSAAKGGVVALTRTLAVEAAPKGVRVNCAVPGLIDVGMTARLDRRIVAAKLAHVSLRRLGTAAEASAAILFLASDDAAYMVGQILAVDGGLSQ